MAKNTQKINISKLMNIISTFRNKNLLIMKNP